MIYKNKLKILLAISLAGFVLFNIPSTSYAHETTAPAPVAGKSECPEGHIDSGRVTEDYFPLTICVDAQPSTPTAPSTAPVTPNQQPTKSASQKQPNQPPQSSPYVVPISVKIPGQEIETIGCTDGYILTSTLDTGKPICKLPGAPDPGAYDVNISTETAKSKKLLTLPPGFGKVTEGLGGYQLAIDIPCEPIAGGKCPEITSIATYIARIYQFMLMIAGLAAFGAIVYGALKYILSAGGVTSQQDAKEQITQAIVGLILLLGAVLILATINPELLNLRNPNAPPVNIDKIIQRGQVDNLGRSQSITGDTRGAGEIPLCSAGSYDKTSITVGGKEQAQPFTCTKCVIGAKLTATNKCECQPNLVFYAPDGYCIAKTSCVSQGGKVEGDQCAVQTFQQGDACTKKKGVCMKNPAYPKTIDLLGPCSGRFEANLCPGPKDIQCCIQ